MNENTEEKNYLENLNEPEEKELFEESDNLDVPEQYREMEDGELVRLAAVSYTHLDVYKRQIEGRYAQQKGELEGRGSGPGRVPSVP